MALNVPVAVRIFDYTPGIDKAPLLSRNDKHITHVLRDLAYRIEIPGGFKSATFDLDRPLSDAGLDLQPYMGVAVYDTRNAATLWEGVLEDPGKSVSADGETWHLSAVGSAAHASDETRPLVFVDRRFDAWELVESQVSGWTVTMETRDSDDEPGIVFRWPRGTGLPAGNVSVSIHYQPIRDAGMKIGIIGGRFDCGRTDASGDHLFQCIVRTGSLSYVAVESDNWTTTEAPWLATRGTDWTFSHDNARLRATWTGAALPPISNDVEWVRVTQLYVRSLLYSKEGVLDDGPYGNPFTRAWNVIEDLLGRVLRRYDGANSFVDTVPSYQIDQLAYPEGATCAQILEDLMLFHPDHFWAAWESVPETDKYRFEWSAWPTKVGYEADVLDGFDQSSGGLELYNKVLVRWKDAIGRTQTVTRTQVVDSLTRANITRSPAPIDVADELASAANATQIGDTFLGQHKHPANSGTLTIARPILDLDMGTQLEPWEVRPGKLVRVRGIVPRVDALNRDDTDAVSVFRGVAYDYRASDNTGLMALDSPVRSSEALLARLENRRLRKR